MQAKEGIGLEFFFIICAVVGGCLLTGGYGSVIGTFFGACILGMVQVGIPFAQWDSNWTYTFVGVILFLEFAVSALQLQGFILPRPSKVIAAFGEEGPRIQRSSIATLYEALGGLVIGVTAGVLTIPLLYAASRELFARRVALVAAAVASGWAMSVSPAGIVCRPQSLARIVVSGNPCRPGGAGVGSTT